MKQPIMEAKGLTKVFGEQMAVNRVSFSVPQGRVVGFLGPNGAGKSTTLKMFMNLLKPSDGSAQIMGQSAEGLSSDAWQKIGYVAEDEKLYGWASVDQMIRYTASFYPRWDRGYCRELVKRLELPGEAKVNTLSKGMRGKLALVLALSYHPELLVLDDPVSGLDPLVRHEFLEQIIDLLHHEGRTVLFSSHIIDEVERIADQILMIRGGRLIVDETLDYLKANVKRLVVSFDGPPPRVEMPGALRITVRDREVHVTVRDRAEDMAGMLKSYQPSRVVIQDLTLSEVFVEFMKGETNGERTAEAVPDGPREPVLPRSGRFVQGGKPQ